jgi:Z1 domain
MNGVAPFGTARVRLEESGEGSTWWSAYSRALDDSGVAERSREVIAADAAYIVDNGVFGAGPPAEDSWPTSRERRGLVMGAVQSGKTASMMAVAAKALDAGVDALVILGGTRTALWKQTFERVVAQLDSLEGRNRRRELLPRPDLVASGGGGPSDFYSLPQPRARRLVIKRRPLIAVVMKNVTHLEHMAAALDVLYDEVRTLDRPFHVLVMDDEADDSSVVDAAAESANDWDFARRKQIPRRILDLWESRANPGETAARNIFATYLAYTATPQANFLQDPSNPLAPREFVASLRTPGAEGDSALRTSSYRVPTGIADWYTGGEIFYKALAPVPLCVPTDDEDADDQLRDAVRAYLVACAVRVLRSGASIGPRTAGAATFGTKGDAQALKPMSMLIHPSAAKDGHFDTADRALSWHGQGSVTADDAPHPPEGRYLDVGRLLSDIESAPERWIRWLEEYGRSASVSAALLGVRSRTDGPPVGEWNDVRTMLVEEVIPGTSVSVINSDENADDRPDFSARNDGSGWRAPRNLSTIFVSGNVMARGLTLDGLTTTLFTRTSTNPLADTQMQMQRWFGYRGAIIDLCRVFMSRAQVELFTSYHENDEALRRDVLAAMTDRRLPDVSVLQGHAFRATGKIANVRGVPLFPGTKPFIRHLTPPSADDRNIELVVRTFSRHLVTSRPELARQGVLLEDTIDLLGAADLLDSLAYGDHGPGPASTEASRWASVANHAGIAVDDVLAPLYRAPSVEGSIDLGRSSPYSIAAYFRTWAACLDRDVPGMVTTDEAPVLWSLVERGARRRLQPRFRIGLRLGSAQPVLAGPLTTLPFEVQPMARSLSHTGELGSTWGSRNSSAERYVGDEFFDYRLRGEEPQMTTSGARSAGSDGLILFHLVDRGAGRVSIAVGLSIPLGGPDHVTAVVGDPHA